MIINMPQATIEKKNICAPKVRNNFLINKLLLSIAMAGRAITFNRANK